MKKQQVCADRFLLVKVMGYVSLTTKTLGRNIFIVIIHVRESDMMFPLLILRLLYDVYN